MSFGFWTLFGKNVASKSASSFYFVFSFFEAFSSASVGLHLWHSYSLWII